MRRELVRRISLDGGKLRTGFIGTPLLCEELTKAGSADLAYSLLMNEEYPGWLFAVNLGATTVWERWNSVLEDGSISSTGMNSLNHYAYGSIAQWIYERCAGISPAEPGFKKAYLRPIPHRALGHLEAEYRSAAGLWKVSWKIENGETEVKIEVPFDCEGLLTLPSENVLSDNLPASENGVITLSPGRYSFKY